jgi:hypothetical protein
VLICGGLSACVELVCIRSVWSFMVVLDGSGMLVVLDVY